VSSFDISIEPSRLTKALIELELESGADIAYLSPLSPQIDRIFRKKSKVPCTFQRALASLLPHRSSASFIPHDFAAWAVENTTFAAQTFLLAATSRGLSTAVMEGFDERRVCYSLGIPEDRYTVPFVVSVGYPNAQGETIRPKRRFRLEDVCYADRFGVPKRFDTS
jgi:Nitroreductase family